MIYIVGNWQKVAKRGIFERKNGILWLFITAIPVIDKDVH
jgi:hypothetical protein